MERVFVIIGASKGIGKALAEHFSGDGFVIAAARSIQGLFGGAVREVTLDLSDFSSYNAIINSLEGRKITDLIITATTFAGVGLEGCTPEVYRQLLDINAGGIFFLVKGLIPHLQENSKILMFNTTASRNYYLQAPLFSMSRAAYYSAYQVFKEELTGVHVTTLKPGIVNTPMLHQVKNEVQGFEEEAWVQPEQIAQFVRYLLGLEGSEFAGKEWTFDDVKGFLDRQG